MFIINIYKHILIKAHTHIYIYIYIIKCYPIAYYFVHILVICP